MIFELCSTIFTTIDQENSKCIILRIMNHATMSEAWWLWKYKQNSACFEISVDGEKSRKAPIVLIVTVITVYLFNMDQETATEYGKRWEILENIYVSLEQLYSFNIDQETSLKCGKCWQMSEMIDVSLNICISSPWIKKYQQNLAKH